MAVSTMPTSRPPNSRNGLVDLFAPPNYNDDMSRQWTINNLFHRQCTDFLNSGAVIGTV